MLNAVCATSAHGASARKRSATGYTTDNGSSGGVTLQMGTVTGSITEGHTVTLTVGVSL